MADQYCEPDVYRLQITGLLYYEANADRQDDLRDDRDEERTLCVAGTLQPASVGKCSGDKKTRYAQHAQKLHADLDDRRVGHAKYREQLTWYEEEK